MTDTQKPLAIYTIGHSNMSIDTFFATLQRYGVRVVVDVRSAPFSKFTQQFNRKPFSQFLTGHGMEYRFAGEVLGGRPTDPTCYFNGVLPDPKTHFLKMVDYAAVAKRDWYLQGIQRLLMIAREQPTTIMCAEGDPIECHRHYLIAHTLLLHGVIVHHIREQALLDKVLYPGVQEELPEQLKLFS